MLICLSFILCPGDIAGFTAWSSTRDPAQVIVLLETVFRAFDEIAGRRGIFKVESVADCWLGVAGTLHHNPLAGRLHSHSEFLNCLFVWKGLPVTRQDHALAVARFAIDIVEWYDRHVLAFVLVFVLMIVHSHPSSPVTLASSD